MGLDLPSDWSSCSRFSCWSLDLAEIGTTARIGNMINRVKALPDVVLRWEGFASGYFGFRSASATGGACPGRFQSHAPASLLHHGWRLGVNSWIILQLQKKTYSASYPPILYFWIKRVTSAYISSLCRFSSRSSYRFSNASIRLLCFIWQPPIITATSTLIKTITFDTDEVISLLHQLDQLEPIKPPPWKSDEEALADFWMYVKEREVEERILSQFKK